jgi:hypothetical protein
LEVKDAIELNDRQAVAYALLDYNGELGEKEQDLGCVAVNMFRKGQAPHAIIALMDAGFDLLSSNADGRCPLEDMVEFCRFAKSRKHEAAEAILLVLSRQYHQLIRGIEAKDGLHAHYLTAIKTRLEKQKAPAPRLV